MTVRLDLPFPPSTNHYWRGTEGSKRVLTRAAREFRARALAAVLEQGAPRFDREARLRVEVTLNPPNRLRRDIDNFGGKALLDALQHAGVFPDDSQVDELRIVRGRVVKGGQAVVTIQPFEGRVAA